MQILKKASVIVCLLAIMVSTNGITIQNHMCSMAGKTTHAIFPEIFGSNGSCCCSLKSMSNTPAGYGSETLSPVPCCKSTFTYSKVVSYNDYRGDTGGPVRVLLNVFDFVLGPTLYTEDSDNNFLSEYRPPPLKLYGKLLLRFISQIRTDLPH